MSMFTEDLNKQRTLKQVCLAHGQRTLPPGEWGLFAEILGAEGNDAKANIVARAYPAAYDLEPESYSRRSMLLFTIMRDYTDVPSDAIMPEDARWLVELALDVAIALGEQQQIRAASMILAQWSDGQSRAFALDLIWYMFLSVDQEYVVSPTILQQATAAMLKEAGFERGEIIEGFIAYQHVYTWVSALEIDDLAVGLPSSIVEGRVWQYVTELQLESPPDELDTWARVLLRVHTFYTEEEGTGNVSKRH